TTNVMKAALTCCMLLQDEKLGYASAVEAVQSVKKTNKTVEETFFRLNLYSEEPGQGPKLYELFAMAGFISDTDMMECLEIHVLRGRQLGHIFIEQGFVSHDAVENAIILQGMITSGAIKAYHAAEALKNAHTKQVSIYQALGELDPPAVPPTPNLTFGQLLIASGIIHPEMLEELMGGMELNARQLAKKALSAGYLTDKSCVTALRCYSLNSEGFIANKQCAEILRQCAALDLNLEEQLAKTGNFAPHRMHWIWK
ncbi:MAG TPA: hypothetical protein PKZ32_06775, partial [Candidatus Melainabacteria bacterium]|nr:hypothetical protein [Candidatus Melainabacteria bacterium]